METRLLFLLIAMVSLLGCQSDTSENQTSDVADELETPPVEKSEMNIETATFLEGDIPINEIDSLYQLCNNFYSGQKNNCAQEYYIVWDKALNRHYKEAIGDGSTETAKATKLAQREWIKFKEKEEQFIDEVIAKIDPVQNGWELKAVVTKLRTFELAVQEFGEYGDYDEFIFKEITAYYGEDEYYETCDGYDGSNMDMRQCAYQTAQYYDKLLNENYKKLMGLLDKNQQEVLKQAQRNWITLKEKEIAIYDAIYKDMGGGTMYPTMQAMENAMLNRYRTIDLEKYIAMIE